MAKVKYTGSADKRSISSADFKKVGVKDQDKAIWDESNDFTTEVSEAASEYLVATRDFEAQKSSTRASKDSGTDS